MSHYLPMGKTERARELSNIRARANHETVRSADTSKIPELEQRLAALDADPNARVYEIREAKKRLAKARLAAALKDK